LKFKSIAFDLVGTIIEPDDWRPLSLAHYRKLITLLSRSRSVEKTEETDNLIEKRKIRLTRQLGREPSLIETVLDLGIDKKTLFNAIDSVDPFHYIRANKKIADTLCNLRKSYKLGILTDTSRLTAERALLAYGIRPGWFDTIVCGDDIQQIKPHLNAFRFLLSELACDAKNVVFVGDRREIDLVPAKRLGMTTILVRQEDCSSVDITTSSLTGLLELILLQAS